MAAGAGLVAGPLVVAAAAAAVLAVTAGTYFVRRFWTGDSSKSVSLEDEKSLSGTDDAESESSYGVFFARGLTLNADEPSTPPSSALPHVPAKEPLQRQDEELEYDQDKKRKGLR